MVQFTRFSFIVYFLCSVLEIFTYPQDYEDFLLDGLQFYLLYWNLWSILSLFIFVAEVKSDVLSVYVYIISCIFSFCSNICWKDYLYFTKFHWHLCWKSTDFTSVHLFLVSILFHRSVCLFPHSTAFSITTALKCLKIS